jgi:hypothetical protein
MGHGRVEQEARHGPWPKLWPQMLAPESHAGKDSYAISTTNAAESRSQKNRPRVGDFCGIGAARLWLDCTHVVYTFIVFLQTINSFGELDETFR